MTLTVEQNRELFALAREKKLVLMEAMKTAYATAYERLLLLLKGGAIGTVVSVEATCTSLRERPSEDEVQWRCIHDWAPTALLPVFQILGVDYKSRQIAARYEDKERKSDSFIKMDFLYDNAVASIKVGSGVKSEGQLIVSGTKGYAYVPAPWWNTDYFELRYEDQNRNKRYFYQLDGEGIRYEIVAFLQAIEGGTHIQRIDEKVSATIARIMEEFDAGRDVSSLGSLID